MSHKKCPMCSQPETHAHRPFCSKRCADVDLGRWLSGRYSIAGEAAAQDCSAEEKCSDEGGVDKR